MNVNNQMLKIVVTGPESSGKTTLTQALAQQLEAPWVSEHAREYLEQLQRPYELEDILAIGKTQQSQHLALKKQQPNYLICDTSFLVLKIWVNVKYQQSNDWLENQFLADPVDLYLLCEPDIPWTFDPLRENPDNRYVLFEHYENALQSANKNYYTVRGIDPNQRLASALKAVRELS